MQTCGAGFQEVGASRHMLFRHIHGGTGAFIVCTCSLQSPARCTGSSWTAATRLAVHGGAPSQFSRLSPSSLPQACTTQASLGFLSKGPPLGSIVGSMEM